MIKSENTPEPKSEVKKVIVKPTPSVKDLKPFYRNIWASHFLTAYIDRLAADSSPWDPTFDNLQVLQELRDRLYPDTEHVLDDEETVMPDLVSARFTANLYCSLTNI